MLDWATNRRRARRGARWPLHLPAWTSCGQACAQQPLWLRLPLPPSQPTESWLAGSRWVTMAAL
eukprot:14564530-Alexandrium_andersonii.AAC.1